MFKPLTVHDWAFKVKIQFPCTEIVTSSSGSTDIWNWELIHCVEVIHCVSPFSATEEEIDSDRKENERICLEQGNWSHQWCMQPANLQNTL